jgi:ATP-dependent DNA helicase RecG
LHQLRGRVGRGAAASYCILMTGPDGAGATARERLAIMENTDDGFEIAQRDLEIRGPGAVFGTQQHGLSDLQFLAMTLQQPGLLDGARTAARRIVQDPAGGREKANALIASLRSGWQKRLEFTRSG